MPHSSTSSAPTSPVIYAIDHTCFCTASCPRACFH